MKHQARKRFGQHFLVDQGVLSAIVRSIDPGPSDVVVEIGPGLAALTEHLLMFLPQLHAIEIDRDLAAHLQKRFGERLHLTQADVLTVDFVELAHRIREQGNESLLRIVGNLPYNISSPLLVHLVNARLHVRDQHFMLQKEVVDRMVSEPGTADYGRLGVLLQCFYHMENVLYVPPEAFDPPPRVDSAVVRMIPRAVPLVSDAPGKPASGLRSLERLLAAAFSQRRKMLRGNFIPWLASAGIPDHGLDETLRAENVSVEQYAGLASRLASQSN